MIFVDKNGFYNYVIVLGKLTLFTTELNSILFPQLIDALNIYPYPMYKVLNVKWSAFVKGILPTL